MDERTRNLVLSVFLGICMILFWAGMNPATGTCSRLGTALAESLGAMFSPRAGEDGEDVPDPASDKAVRIETDCLNTHKGTAFLLNYNGLAARILDIRGFYSNLNIFVGDDGYVMSRNAQTSTDYELDRLTALRDFLDEKGIKLLYVCKPSKYLDDSVFTDRFGLESFTNRNADLLTARTREAGIATLDLRELIRAEGKDITDMFYRTDHHWNVPAALWAAEKIARALNEELGYHIDLSIYDEDRYEFTTWKECWLGEQGRKLGATYTRLEDYTRVMPAFPTSYTFKNMGKPFEGTFKNFVSKKVFASKDLYRGKPWHYAYNMRDVINHNADEGHVLMVTDSYDRTTFPFLSLAVAEMDNVTPRDYLGTVADLVGEGDYDTVIVCLSDIMIGAHDDPDNENRRMFAFF